MLKTCLVACGAVAMAGAVTAAPVPVPVASFDTFGSLSFSATGGLVLEGDFTATYNGAPGGVRPYIFHAAAESEGLTFTPGVTVSTPEIEIGFCPGFLCTTIPGQSFDFDPALPILPGAPLFDETHVSGPLPLGDVLAHDFGSPLFGHELSFGDLIQDQFEQGEALIDVSGVIGPFDGALDYYGELIGNEINGHYSLAVNLPGILDELEAYALDFINDNIDGFTDQLVDLFLASDACDGVVGGLLCGVVPDLPIGEGGITFALNSLGTFSGDYHFTKSITPAPIPLPAGMPLLLGGLGLLGLIGRRRRNRA